MIPVKAPRDLKACERAVAKHDGFAAQKGIPLKDAELEREVAIPELEELPKAHHRETECALPTPAHPLEAVLLGAVLGDRRGGNGLHALLRALEPANPDDLGAMDLLPSLGEPLLGDIEGALAEARPLLLPSPEDMQNPMTLIRPNLEVLKAVISELPFDALAEDLVMIGQRLRIRIRA